MNRMSSRAANPRQRANSGPRNGSARSVAMARSVNASTCSRLGDAASTVGAKAHLVVDDKQPVRLAAGHAEFGIVNFAEQLALIEFDGAFEVAAQLCP